MGLKDWINLVGVFALAASVFFRGGGIVQQVSTASSTLTRIEMRMDAVDKQQAATAADVRVLQERSVAHDERLRTHEARINRLERP